MNFYHSSCLLQFIYESVLYICDCYIFYSSKDISITICRTSKHLDVEKLNNFREKVKHKMCRYTLINNNVKTHKNKNELSSMNRPKE